MAHQVQKREAARKLRRAGHSLNEIMQHLGLPKATVYSWIRDLPAPTEERLEITREDLVQMRASGLTQLQMADRLNVSRERVKRECKRHGLTSSRSPHEIVTEADPVEITRSCGEHGETRFVRQRRTGASYRYVCAACQYGYVKRRRQKVRATLIAEHGGACLWCGYNTSSRALHFHHLDPSAKRFSISANSSVVSLQRLREEAQKCVLLCSNHHAEAEEGLITRLQLEDKRYGHVHPPPDKRSKG